MKSASPSDPNRLRSLVADLVFEIVPMASAGEAVAALPANAKVSVTCSPKAGVAATQALAEELLELGHEPIPHIAARQVDGPRHLHALCRWFRSAGIECIFLVAGDTPNPLAYEGAVELLRDLLDRDHGLESIGVTGYPDGHPFIDTTTLNCALMHKQELIRSAGLDAWCSTQMCFNPATISQWLADQAARGVTLPVHLGVAGALDRGRLLRTGTRLGVGTSLRFLRKNRSAVGKLMQSTSYEPTELIESVIRDPAADAIARLHVFTFNQVAATDAWRNRTCSS